MIKSRQLKSKHLVVMVLFLTIFAFVGNVCAGTYLSVASGKAGGTWYPLGGAISQIAQENLTDTVVTTMQGTGDANIMGVDRGVYTMGISFSFANDNAVAGRHQFKSAHSNLAGLASLYPAPIQIVVRADSDIKSVADLKGKRIAPGLKGTSGEVLIRTILNAYGLSYKDMKKVEHLAYSDAAMLLKDGHLDAFMPFTTVPAPVIQDVAVSIGGVRIISIGKEELNQIGSTNSGYSQQVIKAGTYVGQEEDVLTVGSNNVLIVQKKLDDESVYKITKGLVENKKKLEDVHQVLKTWSPEFAVRDLGVALHPGAAKYYREIGAIK